MLHRSKWSSDCPWKIKRSVTYTLLGAVQNWFLHRLYYRSVKVSSLEFSGTLNMVVKTITWIILIWIKWVLRPDLQRQGLPFSNIVPYHSKCNLTSNTVCGLVKHKEHGSLVLLVMFLHFDNYGWPLSLHMLTVSLLGHIIENRVGTYENFHFFFSYF